MGEVTKKDVLEMIERMPEDASLDDIMYELYVRASIERGLQDIAEGRTVPHEDVVRKMQAWLASAGQ